MNLQAVKSSNLAAVGYDRKSKTLTILFLEGSMYDYFNVPAKLYNALMKSESKGSFFQEQIKEQFEFRKVNPENLAKESTSMGQNKAQKQAAERAAAAAPKAAQPAVGPNVGQINADTGKVNEAPAPAVAVVAPSKQDATIAKLKEAWTAKGVNLSKLTIKDDGKFKLLIVDAGWPTVQIGPTGGITVVELKSYVKAFDAAVDGLALYQKQQARDQKKAPTPAPVQTPAPAATTVKETVTQKKAKKDAAIEQQMQSA